MLSHNVICGNTINRKHFYMKPAVYSVVYVLIQWTYTHAHAHTHTHTHTHTPHSGIDPHPHMYTHSP